MNLLGLEKRMNSRLTASVLVVASLGVTMANAVQTVIPSQFAAAEGNSSSSSLFQTGGASIQAFYSEAFLTAAGITSGSIINGIAYRRNTGGAVGPAGSTSFDSYSIGMSSSFATSTELTATFANNIIGTQTQVYSGPTSFAANSFPGGGTPNGFGPTIDFTTGYLYTGGSLLIEIRRGTRSGDVTALNTDVDNTVTTQAGARWLFNTSSNAATTGTLSNGAQIFQLQYQPVPEPATMAALALGSAMIIRRRKRSK